jgi:hypothetical protein
MNGSFVLNILRSLVVASLTATAAALWNMNGHLATLDERVANVLRHSDQRDAEFDRQMQDVQNELRRLIEKR